MNYRVFIESDNVTPLVERRGGVHYVNGHKVLRRDHARKHFMPILVAAAKDERAYRKRVREFERNYDAELMAEFDDGTYERQYT